MKMMVLILTLIIITYYGYYCYYYEIIIIVIIIIISSSTYMYVQLYMCIFLILERFSNDYFRSKYKNNKTVLWQ